MAIESTFSVPDKISFEQAIALTQSLLSELEQEKLSEAELEAAIAALVASENGARGFFVTYLTDSRPFADHPSKAVIQALKSSPEIVSDLLVKNLAMSSGMMIAHTRNDHPEMAQGSERVQQRSQQLIRLTQLPSASTKIQSLLESIATQTGAYQPFLERWGYDVEQKQAIQQALQQAIT